MPISLICPGLKNKMMKPLKILLGNNTLSLLAGSERWTQTLALQLQKMGHEVECFSSTLGIISDQLKEQGIDSHQELFNRGPRPFFIKLEPARKHEYDLIIANHNHVVEFLRTQFPKTPIISTIHGVLHFMKDEKGKEIMAPEHPALNSGVNQFLAVSEEVQNKLKKDYQIDSLIVRNFFDTTQFSTKKKITSGQPKRFLINSNYATKDDGVVSVIRQVVKHYGGTLAATGQEFTFSRDMMQAIENSDVVFGMGRSVLEGVCAGRLGIVHGRWGTGGVISDDTVEQLRQTNFSGRLLDGSSSRLFTAEQIILEIDQYYNDNTIEWGKKYIREQHNVAVAAQNIIQIGRSLLGQDIVSANSDRRPYRRQSDVAK